MPAGAPAVMQARLSAVFEAGIGAMFGPHSGRIGALRRFVDNYVDKPVRASAKKRKVLRHAPLLNFGARISLCKSIRCKNMSIA